MRRVRLSVTFNDQLNELLAYGEEIFGQAVAEKKKARVYSTIRNHLAWFPASRVRDADFGLCIYPVTDTPFMLVYDFDDQELRIYFILHQRTDRTTINPRDVLW